MKKLVFFALLFCCWYSLFSEEQMFPVSGAFPDCLSGEPVQSWVSGVSDEYNVSLIEDNDCLYLRVFNSTKTVSMRDLVRAVVEYDDYSHGESPEPELMSVARKSGTFLTSLFSGNVQVFGYYFPDNVRVVCQTSDIQEVETELGMRFNLIRDVQVFLDEPLDSLIDTTFLDGIGNLYDLTPSTDTLQLDYSDYRLDTYEDHLVLDIPLLVSKSNAWSYFTMDNSLLDGLNLAIQARGVDLDKVDLRYDTLGLDGLLIVSAGGLLFFTSP